MSAAVAWRRLQAILEEAALSLGRRKAVAAATAACIGLGLTFPALALTALAWMREAAEELVLSDRVRVVLSESASAAEVDHLVRTLRGVPGVEAVRRVSSDEALRRFMARFPELAPVAEELSEDELRLPATLEVSGAAPEVPVRVREALRGMPGHDEIRHDARWRDRAERLRKGCGLVALCVSLLALGVAGFGIANVVGIGALVRREELSVLRLVGSPWLHLRAPTWVEGLVQGAAGGVLAALGTSALVRLGAPAIRTVLPAATPGLPARLGLLLVAGAGLAGTLGAACAVEWVLRRHARLER